MVDESAPETDSMRSR